MKSGANRRATLKLIAMTLIAASFAAGLAFPASAERPARRLTAIDRGATWYESSAWGGGAATTLDLPDRQTQGAPSWGFLAGAAPQLIVGCSRPAPGTGHWRLRAGVSAPGSGVMRSVPGAEKKFEEGIKRAFGAPGTVILFDERDKEFARIAIASADDALETGPLDRGQLKSILDASRIRIETPRIVLESGTVKLPVVFAGLRNSPCGPAAPR